MCNTIRTVRIAFLTVIIFLVVTIIYDLYKIKHPSNTPQLSHLLFFQKLKPKNVAPCPNERIVSTYDGGRLGNQMWEYASVYVAAQETGLRPYIPEGISKHLNRIFKNTNMPILNTILTCPEAQNFKEIRSIQADDWNITHKSLMLRLYAREKKLIVHKYWDAVRDIFTFKDTFANEAQRLLELYCSTKNLSGSNDDCTFVGVHVRRTDYARYLFNTYRTEQLDLRYYLRAMKYFEARYRKVVFVVVSDDVLWCNENFPEKPNLHIAHNDYYRSFYGLKPGLDLAILAACNHCITDYGTYGEWGALLAGGETIFHKIRGMGMEHMRLTEDWHPLNMTV